MPNPLAKIENGWFTHARHVPSQFYNQRPEKKPDNPVSLLVIHNISLPPGDFGGDHVERLFTGRLQAHAHPYFETIIHLEVSAHLFIRRDGELVQFVSLEDRAWHAGVSSFQGRTNCNDYAIGIEMEGTDERPYTDLQYQQLEIVTRRIQLEYPDISLGRIVGHNDIAPNRKTDPGPHFDWPRYRTSIT